MPSISVPDLYRSGNITSPRFDNVWPKDIPVKDGKVKPGTGGLSTFSHPDRRWPKGKTWKLAGGTNPDSDLTARNDYGSHWLLEPSREMSFSDYKASLMALNATHVDDQKPENSLNIQLPAHSNNHSRAIRFLYEPLHVVAKEKVHINDWDENDYTYLSILALHLHLSTGELSNFIYTPGEPSTKEQVLIAEATSAYIMKKDTEYGYGEYGDDDDDDDDDDDKSMWGNDRGYLRAILNTYALGVHPIPILCDDA